MIEAFTLGPLLVPVWPVLVLASLVVAVGLAARLATRAGQDRDACRATAEVAAWTGLLGARVVFVVLHWPAYQPEPWTALYLWQPGYSPAGGMAVGTAFVLWRSWRARRADRWVHGRILASAYGLAAVPFVAAVVALHLFAPPGTPRTGDPVQDFSLVDLAGETVHLSDLRGRGVVLNFWASWCPPCVREMPLLDDFDARFSARGVTVVGVNLDEPPGVVARFVERTGVNYAIWTDPGPARTGLDRTRAVYDRLAGVGLPTTVFIDRDGRVVGMHVGELSRALLESRVAGMLESL